MQYDKDTDQHYDERTSKDDPSVEYTIMGNQRDGWHVDCWKADGSNHWNRWFKWEDKDKALAEFNRFP